MAGHDFMDYLSGSGGSDGCTDMSHPENAGLMDCLTQGRENGISLNDIYGEFCHKVSIADFIVVSAESVMYATRQIARRANSSRRFIDFRARFRYGRTTAKRQACQSTTGRLPDPELGCSEVDRVFVRNMGLTRTEATALMGVHTLGRAQRSNSGYDGWWSGLEESREFTNDYYISMISKGWIPGMLKKAGGLFSGFRHQWDRSDEGKSNVQEMMLNTDMCLAYSEDEHGRVPVNAKQHKCCTWLHGTFPDGRSGLGRDIVKESPEGHCGYSNKRATRGNCCGNTDANPFIRRRFSSRGRDCGDPFVLGGYAGSAVMKFAKNEESWIKYFLRGWRKATENGFRGRLHALKNSCPTGGEQRRRRSTSNPGSSIVRASPVRRRGTGRAELSEPDLRPLFR